MRIGKWCENALNKSFILIALEAMGLLYSLCQIVDHCDTNVLSSSGGNVVQTFLTVDLS